MKRLTGIDYVLNMVPILQERQAGLGHVSIQVALNFILLFLNRKTGTGLGHVTVNCIQILLKSQDDIGHVTLNLSLITLVLVMSIFISL